MAEVRVYGSPWLFPQLMILARSPADYSLDSASEKIGAVFVAQKAGTIDRIVFNARTVLAPPTYDFRIETTTSSSNFCVPSGTLIAANTNKTFSPSSTGVQTVTLTSSHTVAAGDVLAVVIEYSSGTIGGSNYCAFRHRHADFDTGSTHVFYDPSGGGWLGHNYRPGFGCLYSDGEACPDMNNLTGAVGEYAWMDSASSPDERGNLFTSPVDFKCHGAAFLLKAQNSGNPLFDVKLYDSADTLLASKSIDPFTDLAVRTNEKMHRAYWDPVELSEGSQYRVTMTPATADNIATYRLVDAADVQSAMGDCQLTERTNAGAWTNNSSDAMLITPLIYSYMNPAGGGGLAQLVDGGLVG